MDDLTSTTGLVAIAAAVVALAALAVAVVAVRQLRRLRRAQSLVLGPHGETDVIAHAAALQQSFEALQSWVEDVAHRLDGRLGVAEHRLDGAITHHALVRYDAYNEMSGHQSTTIALLDAERSGVVLSSIHHRDQARMYAKQIRGGASDLALSPEEEEAIRAAVSGPDLQS